MLCGASMLSLKWSYQLAGAALDGAVDNGVG